MMPGKSAERQNQTRQHERRPSAPALAGPRGVSLQPPGRGTSHLPEALKNNVEQLAGQSLDDVTVRYHSPEPAKVKALAFTRGSEIHLAPGQAARLPHELWHVVQQKAGRVQPTARLLGRPLNDDPHLEAEAARMGLLAQARLPLTTL
ncbi:MAG: DUF4157 domain-containing protein [Ardenticatenales bacterium]|nr:DUF4157 domain-containing protein [Ardenticatenales bacterium]